MEFQPLEDASKQTWIDWLSSQQTVLNGKENDPSQNKVFETGTGDVNAAKDLVGTLLATLTQKTVTIL